MPTQLDLFHICISQNILQIKVASNPPWYSTFTTHLELQANTVSGRRWSRVCSRILRHVSIGKIASLLRFRDFSGYRKAVRNDPTYGYHCIDGSYDRVLLGGIIANCSRHRSNMNLVSKVKERWDELESKDIAKGKLSGYQPLKDQKVQDFAIF